MSTESYAAGTAEAGLPAVSRIHRSRQIVRRIKEQMGGHDMSRQELADRTGINRVTLTRRLNNQLPITIDEVELIAEALDVDFDWLITGLGEPFPPGVPPAGFEPAAFCSEEGHSENIVDLDRYRGTHSRIHARVSA